MAGHFGFGELFDPKRPDEDPDGNESGNREDETFARLVRRLNNIVRQSEVKSPENPEAQLDPAEELHEYKAMMDVLTGDPMLLPTESNYLSLACAVLHNASKCTRLGLPVLLSHHRVLLEKGKSPC
ncbi:hypothetical protein MRX96_002746 [Rhipicephalus microplus]